MKPKLLGAYGKSWWCSSCHTRHACVVVVYRDDAMRVRVRVRAI